MRILVVWGNLAPKKRLRNTVVDYLNAFPKYDKENTYYFLNIPRIASNWDYKWIKEGMFDAILFTCTFLGIRWDRDEWRPMWDMCERVFGPLTCKKVILPQDDYDNTAKLWDFVRRVKIDKICTVISEQCHDIVYPRDKIGNAELSVVLTGYVEEKYLSWSFPAKTVDVIYRASKLPYKFGKLGQQKTELIDRFAGKFEGLVTDIRNTVKKSDVYSGDSWIEHLAMARCVLGCPSGSSVLDVDGEVGNKYSSYLSSHPEASYEEAKMNCFPELEENIKGVIGPRNIEAAMTRTCQVLIRGDYSGILRENIDYIPIDETYDNIDEVIEKIKDKKYCTEIANNCYGHVVSSGLYTYSGFVKQVLEGVHNSIASEGKLVNDRLIKCRCFTHNTCVDSYVLLREIYGKCRSAITREN